MNFRRMIFALAAVSLLLAGGAQAADSSSVDGDLIHGFEKRIPARQLERLDALLYDYEVLEIDPVAITRQVQRENALRIHLGNRAFELALVLNDLRDPVYQAVVMTGEGKARQVDPGPVTTYRGSLIDDPKSLVRVTVQPDLFEGYIRTGEEWVFIDPLSRFVDGAPDTTVVLYKDEDVRPEAGGLCGSEHLGQVARDLGVESMVIDVGEMTEAPRRLQVATDADGQYFSRYGNPGLFNRIQSVLNGVDGIYRADLNLFISITYQQAWPNAGTDPYTSLDATTTLNQFRTWWNANRGGTVRDTAHLFSDKNFNGSTVGIAWVGVVCNNPGLSYGVSEDQSSSFLNVQLTGHEIGHNLSAGHDNQSPVCSGVSCNGSGPVMCSFLQSSGSNRFSSCSRSSVASHVASFGSCLN